MTTKKRRVPIFVKVLIVVFSFLLIICGAFVGVGIYVHREARVMPDIFIDGIDISWLTYDEAIQMLGVLDEESRAENVSVALQMPLDLEKLITGEDVNMQVDTRSVVKIALGLGRGTGFFGEALFFVERFMGRALGYAVPIDLESNYSFDTGNLYDNISSFTEEFNYRLGLLVPHVGENSITITLGAGHTKASSDEVYLQVLEGLLTSFRSGEPVTINYTPPEFEEFRLVQELEKLWQQTRVLPISAEFDRETRTILSDIPGVAFDFVEAVSLLRTTDTGESAIIEFIQVEPEVTKEYLESVLFADLFGQETTRVGGSDNRRHNVMLAAEAVDGYILYPDEEFSFNRIVGRRTAARGFRSAPVLAYGQFVPGIGGGICQVSSTLFSAIMDTNIQITERRPHGRPVDYLPRGRDATVAWGLIDFRFVNNTELPLRISVSLEGRTLTAWVEGTLPDDWS